MNNTPKKVTGTETKGSKESDPLTSLRTKLKAADPEIQNYVTALETENLKFQKHVAKLQANNVTLNNRITILEENTNERCVHESPPYECMKKKKDMIQEEIKQLESKKR